MFLLACFAPGMLTEASGGPTERGRDSWRLAFYCRSHVQSGLDSSEVRPCRLRLAAAARSSSGRASLRLRPPPPPIWLDSIWRRRLHVPVNIRSLSWYKAFLHSKCRLFSTWFSFFPLRTNVELYLRVQIFQLQMWINDIFLWINCVSDVSMIYSLAKDPSGVCGTCMKRGVWERGNVQTTVATGSDQEMKNPLSKFACKFKITPLSNWFYKIWNHKLCQPGRSRSQMQKLLQPLVPFLSHTEIKVNCYIHIVKYKS